MLKNLLRFAPFGLLASIALSAGTARADIALSLNGGAPTLVGSNYLYTYTATLTPGTAISANGQFPVGLSSPNTSNFVTVYDVQGYIANTAVSSVFPAISSSVFGITPIFQTPPDSGTPNLTFAYNGAPQDATTTAIVLGTIQFQSTIGTTGAMYYSAATQRDSGPGLIANNTSVILGPTAVPEPGPVALSLVAAAVCGLGYRARNRKVSFA